MPSTMLPAVTAAIITNPLTSEDGNDGSGRHSYIFAFRQTFPHLRLLFAVLFFLCCEHVSRCDGETGFFPFTVCLSRCERMLRL